MLRNQQLIKHIAATADTFQKKEKDHRDCDGDTDFLAHLFLESTRVEFHRESSPCDTSCACRPTRAVRLACREACLGTDTKPTARLSRNKRPNTSSKLTNTLPASGAVRAPWIARGESQWFYHSTRKLLRTKQSMPLLEKALNAFAGEFTMGSPRRLKDVFSTIGSPVACPKRSIRR